MTAAIFNNDPFLNISFLGNSPGKRCGDCDFLVVENRLLIAFTGIAFAACSVSMVE